MCNRIPKRLYLFLSTSAFMAATSLLMAGLSGPRGQTTGSARLADEVERRTGQVESQVIAWRRDLHEHPELSNREVRTARIVADHLRSLGIEVREGVAHTGVLGTLRGGRPGPAIALRADMDELPVAEEVNLPFASKVRATFNGREV